MKAVECTIPYNLLEGNMDWPEDPVFTKYGVFLHVKIPPETLDKFTRFYEVRFSSLLTDYAKQCACLFKRNCELFSDIREITYVTMISKLSEKAKVGY